MINHLNLEVLLTGPRGELGAEEKECRPGPLVIGFNKRARKKQKVAQSFCGCTRFLSRRIQMSVESGLECENLSSGQWHVDVLQCQDGGQLRSVMRTAGWRLLGLPGTELDRHSQGLRHVERQ